MRITQTTESTMGTTTIEIDTEAAPALVSQPGAQGDLAAVEPRLPTHQEYEIIRDLLNIASHELDISEDAATMTFSPGMAEYHCSVMCPGMNREHLVVDHIQVMAQGHYRVHALGCTNWTHTEDSLCIP